MRVDASYGITNKANKFLSENNFYLGISDQKFSVEKFEKLYFFEPMERHFYDSFNQYFSYYTNNKNDVIVEYSQVLFFSSGACEFLALKKFNFESESWEIIEDSLWQESCDPVGNFSPSYDSERGLFCRS